MLKNHQSPVFFGFKVSVVSLGLGLLGLVGKPTASSACY